MKILFCITIVLCAVTQVLSAQIVPDPEREIRNRELKPNDVQINTTNRRALNLSSNTPVQGEWREFKNWNEATAVVAENDSIVWVGTKVGLVRWNIQSGIYTTYDEKNGLSQAVVSSLALDRNKKLWITTSKGVVSYFMGIFTSFNFQNSNLPDAPFTLLAIDSSNRVYAGYGWHLVNNTWLGGGVAVYDGARWSQIECGGPTSMCVYHDTVLVGESDNIYLLRENSAVKMPGWSGGVASMAVDCEDSLWAISRSGNIQKYAGDRWKIIINNDSEYVRFAGKHLWNDPRGGLWFSDGDSWYGPDQTMYRLDINKRRLGQSCTSSWLPKGICAVTGLNCQFNAQFALRGDAQFFATRWGLLKFNGSEWESILAPYTLRSNCVYSLGASPSGEVYLSAEMIEQKTNGITWETIGGQGWIDPEIKFAPDGSLWKKGFGHYATGLDFDGYNAQWEAYGGIACFIPSVGIKEWQPADMGMRQMVQLMDLAVDREENIWATGWYGGSVMYDRTKWHPIYSGGEILPNFDYDRIFADSKNRIWFATNQSSPNYGFTVFENNEWKTYYVPQRWSASEVYQIAEDHFGNIWLATGGGLIRYDGGNFTIIDNTNSPLTSNIIYAVTVDMENNIWIGTECGLFVYNTENVRLGTFANRMPVDSFTVAALGNHAAATFLPKPGLAHAKYELQRGRSVNKYWTVASTGFLDDPNCSLSLTDTSSLIGEYHYRIKRIERNGTTAYSSSVPFTGGQKQIILMGCQLYVEANKLLLKWKTSDEMFVAGFEVESKDTTQKKSAIRIPAASQKTFDGWYLTTIDTLSSSLKKFQYVLNAVFADSSRILLHSIERSDELPSKFTISSNFPNPFNGATTFKIALPHSDKFKMRFFDILGREVLPSISKDLTEGYYNITVDFSGLTSGIYFYMAEAANKRISGKVMFIK